MAGSQMTVEAELESRLRTRGADIVSCIDLTQLSHDQNKGYPNALLIGIKLSPDYINRISKSKHIDADELVDVYLCKSCLLCMALCPRTQEYVNKAYK